MRASKRKGKRDTFKLFLLSEEKGGQGTEEEEKSRRERKGDYNSSTKAPQHKRKPTVGGKMTGSYHIKTGAMERQSGLPVSNWHSEMRSK